LRRSIAATCWPNEELVTDRSQGDPDHNHRGGEMDTRLRAYACVPHGITDTQKEQPGGDLLAFLNSTAAAPGLVGFSTGKGNA
jgi:hypothetical protein